LTNPPKISIVTPSYNQGEFIEDCIRSVISQKGDFYIDYVIVDGGSTDNSVEVIKKYDALIKEGKWPIQCRGIRYRWVSEKDSGQSDAINKGFSMAEGNIAAWLNSDDFYIQGAFARVVNAFQNDWALAMVYGDGEVVDKSGSVKMQYNAEPLFDLWKLVHLYDFILQPSVFMRPQAFKRAGRLNEKLHYIMDWELWIRLSRFGKIRHLPDRLSCARVYPEAKTQASGFKRWKEIRWCSKKYGHMKWPPVVFTQLFHRPFNVISGGAGGGEKMLFSSIIGLLKKAYYCLIRGNRSGIFSNGCVERTGFLSIPLRDEVATAVIRLKPLCPTLLKYIINNRYPGSILFKSDIATIEVAITAEMKKTDFLHIKFASDKNIEMRALPMTSAERKGSFLIQDISLKMADGSAVRDIGLPEFQK